MKISVKKDCQVRFFPNPANILMRKHLHNFWTGMISSSSSLQLYPLQLHCIRLTLLRLEVKLCKPMNLKVRVKSKFTSSLISYYKLLTEKGKRTYIFEVLFFLKHAVTVNLNKFSSDFIFKWYTSVSFTNSFFQLKKLVSEKQFG